MHGLDAVLHALRVPAQLAERTVAGVEPRGGARIRRCNVDLPAALLKPARPCGSSRMLCVAFRIACSSFLRDACPATSASSNATDSTQVNGHARLPLHLKNVSGPKTSIRCASKTYVRNELRLTQILWKSMEGVALAARARAHSFTLLRLSW